MTNEELDDHLEALNYNLSKIYEVLVELTAAQLQLVQIERDRDTRG